MEVKIENLRSFVAEVEIKGNHELYKDIIVLDYGVKPKGSEKICQIKFTFEKKEDLFFHSTATCGCTKPKIHNVEDGVQVVEISYDTNIKGVFSKQVNLYDESKERKQIVNVKGEIV